MKEKKLTCLEIKPLLKKKHGLFFSPYFAQIKESNSIPWTACFGALSTPVG